MTLESLGTFYNCSYRKDAILKKKMIKEHKQQAQWCTALNIIIKTKKMIEERRRKTRSTFPPCYLRGLRHYNTTRSNAACWLSSKKKICCVLLWNYGALSNWQLSWLWQLVYLLSLPLLVIYILWYYLVEKEANERHLLLTDTWWRTSKILNWTKNLFINFLKKTEPGSRPVYTVPTILRSWTVVRMLLNWSFVNRRKIGRKLFLKFNLCLWEKTCDITQR